MSTRASVAHREGAALVVVDIQDRLAAAMAHKDSVVKAVALVVRVASIVGLPTIVTRQYPKGLGDLVPEVDGIIGEARVAGTEVHAIDKVSFDCFAEPAFTDALERIGRRQLIVAGMETHICICQTSLAALQQGYDVHVVADACCSRADANHTCALDRLGRAGAVVSTSESVAYELVGVAGTPEFKALLSAVKGESPVR